jgi:hypothetical protein
MSQTVKFVEETCPAESIIQYSIQFDGVNERIIGQTTLLYDFEKTDSFSIAVKFKPVNNGINQAICSKWLSQTGYALWLQTTGALVLEMRTGAYINGSAIETITAINSIIWGSWNHLVFTYDGTMFSTGAKIYVNNILIPWLSVFRDGITLSTMVSSFSNLEIGSDTANSRYLSGKIKDFRVWDKELSLLEIASEYSNFSNHTATPSALTNLKGWCTMGTENDAIWGLDTWTFKDKSDNGLGFRGVNLEFLDRTTDIP